MNPMTKLGVAAGMVLMSGSGAIVTVVAPATDEPAYFWVQVEGNGARVEGEVTSASGRRLRAPARVEIDPGTTVTLVSDRSGVPIGIMVATSPVTQTHIWGRRIVLRSAEGTGRLIVVEADSGKSGPGIGP
jgi:hypothetical protein